MTGYRVIVATIRYGKGRFEEAFSRPERVVQIILKVLESVSTHRIGQLIQVYFNRYFGGTALAYKGQESLSSNRTSQKYLLLNESAEERIQSLLEMVRSGIGFIMEDDETRERARQIASFSTTVAALSGNVANDQQTVETALDEQHTTMKPLLHKTARAIHEVLKVSPE